MQMDKSTLKSDVKEIQRHGGGLIQVHNTGYLEDAQGKLWNFPWTMFLTGFLEFP